MVRDPLPRGRPGRHSRGRRARRGPMSTVLVVTLYAGIGLAALGCFAAAAYQQGVVAEQPVHWGVFTETREVCGGRGGCHSVGDFASDDGRVTASGVDLDGSVGDDGTAVAGYRDDDVWDDDGRPDVVHDGGSIDLGPVVFAAFGVGVLAYGVSVAWKRGDLPRLLRRRRVS